MFAFRGRFYLTSPDIRLKLKFWCTFNSPCLHFNLSVTVGVPVWLATRLVIRWTRFWFYCRAQIQANCLIDARDLLRLSLLAGSLQGDQDTGCSLAASTPRDRAIERYGSNALSQKIVVRILLGVRRLKTECSLYSSYFLFVIC